MNESTSEPHADLTGPADDAPEWYHSFRGALAVVIPLFLLRLVLQALNPLNLYADEAYYWGWSQSLEWGYYSKPPMVAWVIALTTAIGGNGEFWIRLGGNILHSGSALLLYGVGRTLYDRRIGFWASAAFATMPAMFLAGMIISTDAPFLFFWSLTMLFFAHAVKTDRWGWWLLTGLAGGLGMLSKYTMCLAAVSCFLLLVTRYDLRRHLWNPKAIIGALIGIALFLPNVFWNMGHHWSTVAHTRDNADLGGGLFNPIKLLEFVASQFGVFGPILFFVLLRTLSRPYQFLQKQSDALLYWFVVPMLGVITGVSFLTRAHANWAAPAFTAAAVLVTAHLVRSGQVRWVRRSVILHGAVGLLAYLGVTVLLAVNPTLPPKLDGTKRLRNWDRLGEIVSRHVAAHPDAVVVGHERKALAEIIYYTHPQPLDAVMWNIQHREGVIRDHFDLTTDMNEHIGRDVLFVTNDPDDRRIVHHFENITLLESTDFPVCSNRPKIYHVYLARGFKGY